MFPACLRILLDGTTHYFDCPNDAWDWLEDYKCEHPKTGSPGGDCPATSRAAEWLRRCTRKGSSKKPTPSQTEERAGALRAVAGLLGSQGSTLGDEAGSPKESEGSETDASISSSVKMPDVMPRTADDII